MRGSFLSAVAAIPQAILDQINNATSMAAQAQTTANAAQTAGSNAQQSATAATTAADNLATAVANGNAVHTDLQNQINANKRTLAIGNTKTTAIALGASADLVLTLTRAMPNTTYNVDIIPAAALIGGTTITVKTKTTTTVTLTVTATLAVTAGLGITAICYG